MMIFVNAFTTAETVPLFAMRTFLVLLNPFAPHLSSELWESLKFPGQITEQSWPNYDAAVLAKAESERAVQKDGRFIGVIKVPASASKEEVQKAAESLPKAPATYMKIIFAGDKAVNFVTKDRTTKPEDV